MREQQVKQERRRKLQLRRGAGSAECPMDRRALQRKVVMVRAGARDVVERAVGGWSEEVDQGEVARGWLCESEAPKPRVVWRSWQLYGCGG